MPCTDLTELAIRITSATGGFLGGTSMMLYMRPGSLVDALRRGGVSVVGALMFAPLASEKLFDHIGSETIMGCAFAIGFTSWSLLGAVAKFFESRQGQDIVQLAKAAKPTESE